MTRTNTPAPPLGIVYFSNVTNNTHRFVEKLNWKDWTYRIPINGELPELPNDPYILISPSYGTPTNSHIPPQVKKWLAIPENRQGCIGIIGAGHLNFGDEFGASGYVLSKKLNVPLLYIFELAGTTKDVEAVNKGLLDIKQKLIIK